MRASLFALLLTLPLAAQVQTQPKPSFATPSLSPDGKELAFASGGDLWTAPSTGGVAHLLLSDPAEESRPLYSPDGKRLAFQSTRTGANDIYILTFATGTLQRLTFTDAPITLDAWSTDGLWIYFTSSANDVAGQGDIFRVHSTGGTPLEVSRERYLNEFESTPSPDGKSIVLVAKGISSGQWWRNGHAHIDETELWLKPLAAPSATDAGYKLLIPADAKHAWPMFSPDGKSLYFMSDKSGAENIWQADASTGVSKPITTFKSGRCLWPTLSYDGKTILFERNFAIWKLDLKSGKSEELSIELRGVPSTPGITHTQLASWSGLALSPDGKKIAVVAHGDIFAAGAREGGEPQRLTSTDAAESDPQWSPDSTKLVYLSERDGGSSLYEYDFTTSTERALTHSTAIDLAPVFSPDGKSLAFLRNRKELHVLTLDKDLSKISDKTIATGEINSYTSGSIAFSPDSHWVVYVSDGINQFSNLNAVPADGSAPSQPITFLANGVTASRIAWSPDGKYILFDTEQRAENPKIARVDLIPHVPAFREDQFRDLFRQQSTPGAPDTPSTTPNRPRTTPSDSPTPPADSAPSADTTPRAPRTPAPAKKPEPTRIVFDGIRDRLTLLPIDLDLDSPFHPPLISPDGKILAFVAEDAGQQNIYTYSLDELSREPATPRQLTSTPGSKSSIAFTPDSKELFFLEGGGRGAGAPGGEAGSGVRSISLDTRIPKPLALATSIDVDFDHEKMVVFDEAWTTLDHRFWNPKFNGVDWPALRDKWRPYIAGARTGPELRRDINLLIGELNSSHSGISKPALPSVRTGRLGLRFDREPFESTGALVIREIIPLGPAALATLDSKDPGPAKDATLKVGDHLLAVNSTPITPSTNLDSLLEDKSGKRTVLSIAPAGDISKKYDAVVRPVPLQVESGLLYRDWVNSRRAYVDKISNGKLGYVHIAAMGDSDLAQLYLDLDVQNQSKQGVVVDVRNNNGGYVNGRVIDVFARHNYLLMTPRDGSTAPSRQALGQRALGLPTVLVTNESTLSDGEDFTEGYRTLELGKVVGTPTAGWIIFTGAQRLLDGSSVRTPGDEIRDTRGQNMEMHPRPVDIEQLRPLGETETNQDIQLQKAVSTLLTQLK